MAWHRFAQYSDDDLYCTQHGCGLVVTDTAVDAVETPCPAPPCPDLSNPDGTCFVVPTEVGAECSYCGTSTTLEDLGEDDDDPDPLLV